MKMDALLKPVPNTRESPPRDIETSVNAVLEHMSNSLVDGDRIEIRGFGSIGLRYRAPRIGRNPKNGDSVSVPGKHVPHFKPGRLLRERVNKTKTDVEASAGRPEHLRISSE